MFVISHQTILIKLVEMYNLLLLKPQINIITNNVTPICKTLALINFLQKLITKVPTLNSVFT